MTDQMRTCVRVDTFELRAHAGVRDSYSSLVASFLLASSINHGSLLAKAPVLQYLYDTSLIASVEAGD